VTIDQRYAANGMRAVPLQVTPDAMDMFTRWYATREGGIFERRLDTYAPRLMVLIAASSGRDTIDREVMTAVLALVRYQLEARREADPVDAENTIAQVEEKVRRILARGAVAGRELKRRANYNRVGLWVWNTAITNLLRAGEVRDEKQARSPDTAVLFWMVPAPRPQVECPPLIRVRVDSQNPALSTGFCPQCSTWRPVSTGTTLCPICTSETPQR
jgi:hypothetical protein